MLNVEVDDLKPGLRVLAVCLVLLVPAVAALTKLRPTWRPLSTYLVAGSVAVVLCLTLVPPAAAGDSLKRIASFSASGYGHGFLGVNDGSLNIALFVPLGFIAAVVARRWTITALSFVLDCLLSLSIETLQYAIPQLGRTGFQFVDVLSNVTGAAIGTLLGLIATAVVVSLPRQSSQRHVAGPEPS